MDKQNPFTYDIMFEVMLYVDSLTITKFCSTDRMSAEICSRESFWKERTKLDFGESQKKVKDSWKGTWRCLNLITSINEKENYIVLETNPKPCNQEFIDKVRSDPFTFNEASKMLFNFNNHKGEQQLYDQLGEDLYQLHTLKEYKDWYSDGKIDEEEIIGGFEEIPNVMDYMTDSGFQLKLDEFYEKYQDITKFHAFSYRIDIGMFKEDQLTYYLNKIKSPIFESLERILNKKRYTESGVYFEGFRFVGKLQDVPVVQITFGT